MLKKSLFTILLACGSIYSFSQNIDSIAFVDAKWTKQRVAPKVKLVTHHFNEKDLFGQNENISYIEVNTRGRKPVFGIGAEVKALKVTSDFADSLNAIAAVNGNFFDIPNGGSVDYVRLNGSVLSQNRLEKNNQRARHQSAAVVIKKGNLSIEKWDGTDAWEMGLTGEDVMLSGPLLTYKNVDENIDTSNFNTTRHPRTCIGIKPNGNVILLTTDGRNQNAAGLSMVELKKIMRWLGCSSSINLDGGGSTTMWVKKQSDNGIVNYPSDNKKWDHKGQRKVANVILVKRK